MRPFRLSALCLSFIGLLLLHVPARAAFPGRNGGIAFNRYSDGSVEIYSISPDGTGLLRLSNNPADDYVPVWSPDGTKIAFWSDRDGNRDIYIMNADGSGVTNVTGSLPDYSSNVNPTWSPDGSRIAFEQYLAGQPEIYTINVDGTNPVNLTNDSGFDGEPAWSPDGSRIAFVHGPSGIFIREIYVMNTDGSNVVNITNTPTSLNRTPSWAPDGDRIAFARGPNDAAYDIFVMDADGSNQTRLTNFSGIEPSPAWSPDGLRIAFVRNFVGVTGGLFTMRPDGSSVTQVTFDAFFPDWQPLPSTLGVLVTLEPNVINLKSHPRWVTGYIEPLGFDLVSIDLSSLRLAGSVPAAPKFAKMGDHNANGIPDLMVKFSRPALDPLLKVGLNQLEVTGSLVSGQQFQGSDQVRVIHPPGAHPRAAVAPNPFNPTGVLTFTTTMPGPVSIKLFDIRGGLVRTLIEARPLEAGSHEVGIDGRGEGGRPLASGVYFFRIEAPGETEAGRIAILK